MKRSLNNIFAALLIMLFSFPLIASQSDSLLIAPNTVVKIDSIQIKGNETTEDFVILRELTFNVGDSIAGKALNFNRERVYSLGIFNIVKFYILPNPKINILVIDVQESWYIYPIPFIKFRDDGIKDASYGMNFLYKNFRGRNETLQFLISIGYDPIYSIAYFNPLINEKNQLSLLVSGAYQSLSNKSEMAKTLYGSEFEYDFYGGLFSLGKRINQFNSAYLLTGYKSYKAPENAIQGITASGKTEDKIISFGAQYIYDSRDLLQFAKEGVYFSAQYLHNGFGIDNISFNAIELDFREYRNLIGKFNGKWRIANRHTFGKIVPFYYRSFLGSDEYIRGQSKENREGNNYFIMSFEVYHPILEEWILSLDLPFISKKLTTTRVGIQLNFFADTGIAYDNNERWKSNNFLSGYGVGITFLFLPYNSVRFEYALDKSRNGEFLIGTGFSF